MIGTVASYPLFVKGNILVFTNIAICGGKAFSSRNLHHNVVFSLTQLSATESDEIEN